MEIIFDNRLLLGNSRVRGFVVSVTVLLLALILNRSTLVHHVEDLKQAELLTVIKYIYILLALLREMKTSVVVKLPPRHPTSMNMIVELGSSTVT